jgi:kumamolisin
MKKLTHTINRIWGAAKIASILLALGAVSASGQTSERKLFANSVVPLPATRGFNVQRLKPEQANDKLEIHFSLKTRNVSELQGKIEKGESVGSEEMERDYLPLPLLSDYESLLAWLKAEGFEITETSGDRTDIYARGTVALIEKSLQVKMVSVTVEGLTYDSAQTAPSLPSDIGAHVLAINGLQPFLKAQRRSVKFTPHSTGFIRSSESPTPACYLFSEVLGAYNANNLPVTGAGQKIAILIDTVPDDEDLKAFWTNNKLPVTLKNIEKINVNGGSLPAPEGEETLDVEWSTGAAPGATVGFMRPVPLVMSTSTKLWTG